MNPLQVMIDVDHIDHLTKRIDDGKEYTARECAVMLRHMAAWHPETQAVVLAADLEDRASLYSALRQTRDIIIRKI